MVIKNEDNRSIVTNFNIDGIDAVVGIDFSLIVSRPNSSKVVTNVGTKNIVNPLIKINLDCIYYQYSSSYLPQIT